MKQMRILRAQDRKAMPWKNGGGTTSEIAVHPPGAGLDDFGWRVSIAEVRSGGPFSLFPQIDRRIAILKGSMTLAIDGKAPVTLSPETQPLTFPGDVATDAKLIEGAVTDLNVMTRRGAYVSRMARREVAREVSLHPRATTLILARTAASFTEGGNTFALSPGDALITEGNPRISFAAAGEVFWIEIEKIGGGRSLA